MLQSSSRDKPGRSFEAFENTAAAWRCRRIGENFLRFLLRGAQERGHNRDQPRDAGADRKGDIGVDDVLLVQTGEHQTHIVHHRGHGHAHGGQWRIAGRGIFAPGQGLFPKLTSGIHDNLVISRGLSNTGNIVPRINNPAEIIYLR